jgi:hypothetical protein
LSIDFDYASFWNQSNQNFITKYTKPEGGQYLPDYYMNSDLDGLTQIRSVKADYTNPINSTAKFDVGLKSSFVTADKNSLFYETINGENVLDAKRSNHFVYNENINAAYANFGKEWEKWGTQIGLRVEHTNVVADQKTLDAVFRRSYTQIFPSLAVQRHLSEQHDLGITLSRRIERPNYEQLNPFRFFIDKTTYKAGYPYINPALAHMIELSHTYKQKFITTVTCAVTNGIIVEVIQPSDEEDSVTYKPIRTLPG